MADVRTLLQREREARRIQHPHLSYSKSGALTCTVCNLNVKSEALWEGHLKSPNHRKNLREASTSHAAAGNGKKRKIEEVTEETPRKWKTEEEELEGEGRKKRQVSFQITDQDDDDPPVEDTPTPTPAHANTDILPGFVKSEAPTPQALPSSPPAVPAPDLPPPVPAAAVDEDEWAAFSAEVLPLARAGQPQDYFSSAAVITAAPISATDLAAQQAAEERRSRRRDAEAEDEKEEEEQRRADEFDVMEEMEERIRRLKEKREALRTARPDVNATPVVHATAEEAQIPSTRPPESDDDDDDGEDLDDWFS